jgi:hypothetical protein
VDRTHGHTWYLTADHIWQADGVRVRPTPPEVLGSIVALLYRVSEGLRTAGADAGTLLVDGAASVALGLAQAPEDGVQRALDYAAAQGWIHSPWGPWITFRGADRQSERPTIYLGQTAALYEGGTRMFPFGWPGRWPGDVVAGVAHWGRLTGVPWQAQPAVQGIEMLHKLMPAVRLPDSTGKIRTRPVERRDDGTPAGATEPAWTPSMWSNPQLGAYRYGYDRRRAGLTAAGSCRVAATRLVRSHRKAFDPDRAGWWCVSVPGWNDPNMPHPIGPHKVYDRAWVTTPTLELVAELARQGVVDMPEIIDSMTGPARPVLQPWARKLEEAYQAAPSDADGYDLPDQHVVREAIAFTYKAAIGMLNHRAGKSSIWRPDWAATIAATKRCNGWRKAWTIGRTEGRWPVAVDDDMWWYATDVDDPYQAAPRGLDLEDRPGGYRPKGRTSAAVKAGAR